MQISTKYIKHKNNVWIESWIGNSHPKKQFAQLLQQSTKATFTQCNIQPMQLSPKAMFKSKAILT